MLLRSNDERNEEQEDGERQSSRPHVSSDLSKVMPPSIPKFNRRKTRLAEGRCQAYKVEKKAE